ncbi:GatB/YqeY domain-containing protein [Ignavibacteriales bacterium]
MNLKEKINEELKSAMKSGDKLRLETIRSIRAVILEYEKSGKGELNNEVEEINMLNSIAKKRKEAADIYRTANRPELCEKEESELKIIMEFLPAQLTAEDIANKVNEIAALNSIPKGGEFSKLMPSVMKELKGKADGALIKKAVEEYLRG